jgi:zinc protease
MIHLLSRSSVVVAMVISASWAPGARLTAQAQPVPAQTFSPQDIIPFDAAVRTGKLPNGVTFYVRQNARPAKRVSLRLAVQAGSMNEADDQRGLAHLIEHMAFNGSAHFKPGELVSYFESTGARLGPHVNAYTSFDETVYMLDLPTDKPEIVERGFTALADFAGGLALDPEQIDKERGVVIEEWRGGLGASSRLRDKQVPVLYHNSRYAERIPIGKPEVIRTAPPERLRAFYDTWYRPDRMAIIVVGDVDSAQMQALISGAFGPLEARGTAASPPDRTVPLNDPLLLNVATDPEVTRSSVQIVRRRPRQGYTRVADYRRELVQRMVEQMVNDRFDEISRKPDAKVLGAGADNGTLTPTVATFTMGASVEDGRIEDGLSALAVEAKRVREYGFGEGEIVRTKKWLTAFYERAYNERDKSESGSFAQEYISHFLEGEPSPGIEYEYRLVQQLLPGITAAEITTMARQLLADSSRVVLAVSPQKPGIKIPTDADLQAALTGAEKAAVTAWNDTTSSRELMERKPDPAAITSRRELPDLGVTIVKFANGVEAWLKPTDFKNDQIVFSMTSPGGASLAPPEDYLNASFATSYVGLSGAGGLKALDLDKLLAGKLASASPFISLSTHGFSGSATPAEFETALQLLYQKFTAPGDDPEAFVLLKRQLESAIANRGQSPGQVFGEKISDVNTSNHYTAQPLTAERLATLDRSKMLAFYRARFSNAADFTMFVVGAFRADEAVPLLARYVGTLPSGGRRVSQFKDVGIHFPAAIQKARVEKGREPRSQTVISFFADPPIDSGERENVSAATTVLETALRDILREDLGQTYTVSVGLSQPLPQKGAGHIEVSFGAAPENVEAMTARVLQEVKKLQDQGPSGDLTNRAKEAARRSYETALKQNGYWLQRLQSANMYGTDPADILHRAEKIDAVTPAIVQAMFRKYFPLDRYTVVTLVPAPGL